MKPFLPVCFIVATAMPLLAAQPSPKHAADNATQKPAPAKPETTSNPAPGTAKPPAAQSSAASAAPAVPDAKPTPGSTVTLNAYLSQLASDVPLSKDEQNDVKTYYLDDGAKSQDILNDASLSPFAQTQQIDALRDTRNAKIAALLDDPVRAAQFSQIESSYRVALVELAAQGGLVPKSATPKVPEPTDTTPAQAEKPAPGIPRQDAVPGT
jgi:hypothetical protein